MNRTVAQESSFEMNHSFRELLHNVDCRRDSSTRHLLLFCNSSLNLSTIFNCWNIPLLLWLNVILFRMVKLEILVVLFTVLLSNVLKQKSFLIVLQLIKGATFPNGSFIYLFVFHEKKKILIFCRWHQWSEWWSMQSWRVKHPGRRTHSLRTTGPRQAPSPLTESTSPTAPVSLWSWRTSLSSSHPEKRFLSLFPPVHAHWCAQPMTWVDMQLV